MADKTTVDLLPISDEDFKAFLDLQISEYAREKIKSGNWVESEAYDLSRKSFMGLLPDGKDTSGHSILTITDAESKTGVGTLWVEWKNKEHNSSYIWDVIIHEKFRRRGYGTLALQLLEKMAKERGSNGISLHVFGHNRSAISMYESLGYYATNIIMKKDLGNVDP